jgi:hypothetical protein
LEEPLPYDFDTASRRTNGWPDVGLTQSPSECGPVPPIGP